MPELVQRSQRIGRISKICWQFAAKTHRGRRAASDRRQVANMVGVCAATAYKWISDGVLPHVRIVNVIGVRRDDFTRLLATKSQRATKPQRAVHQPYRSSALRASSAVLVAAFLHSTSLTALPTFSLRPLSTPSLYAFPSPPSRVIRAFLSAIPLPLPRHPFSPLSSSGFLPPVSVSYRRPRPCSFRRPPLHSPLSLSSRSPFHPV